MWGWRGKTRISSIRCKTKEDYMKLISILIIHQLHPLVGFFSTWHKKKSCASGELKSLLWQRAAAFSPLNAIFNPYYSLAMLFLCSRYVERAHGGHPSVENTVYQRSDLLHRTDDSQDNYSQPKQQAENGSSKCVRTNAETHKTHTVACVY